MLSSLFLQGFRPQIFFSKDSPAAYFFSKKFLPIFSGLHAMVLPVILLIISFREFVRKSFQYFQGTLLKFNSEILARISPEILPRASLENH